MRCRLAVALLAVLAMATTAAAEWTSKWTVLFPTPPQKTTLRPLPEFSINGPHPGHAFYLGQFDADCSWKVDDGLLQPDGKNAALSLGEGENFVMEGRLDASGLGSWFLLVGDVDGRGYGLWNTTMIESGSPWGLFEYRGDRAIDGTAVDIESYEWKGEQPFRLTVQDHAMTLEVGRRKVIDAVPMPNYTAGRVILGAYDTRYGPKKLKLRSLRVRSLPATVKSVSDETP